MRRLPIYFLIDISESMVGEPIQLVEDGIATIIKTLKQDPYALETVCVSIIGFAGQAKTLVPLQEIINFYPPKFPIGGGTSLCAGLGHLMYELRTNIRRTTTDIKGDWKPIIFFFTDGVPTDEPSAVIQEWKANWGTKSNLVAISFGDETDLKLLKDLTENAFLFKNTAPEKYTGFFRWVTASIQASSQSVAENSSGFELSHVSDDVVSKIDLAKQTRTQTTYIDNHFATFIARCQNTTKPYLIKYVRRQVEVGIGGMEMESIHYRLNGAFPVGNDYFELSDHSQDNSKISTDNLEGFPACPSCGNQFGFAVCKCGKIHCVGFEAENSCPWCGNKGKYDAGGGAMDIGRTKG